MALTRRHVPGVYFSRFFRAPDRGRRAEFAGVSIMRSTRFPIARLLSVAVAAATVSLPLSTSAADQDAPSFNPHNFKFLAGIYRCELNRSVDVEQVSPDMQNAVLRFDKKEYKMKAVTARSGALRYEDAQSGLVWLIIASKSMLLDTKHGKQLANECKT